jgi:hypothetical protein
MSMIVLHCTVLYFIALYCALLHCTVPGWQGTDGWNKYYGIDRIITPPYDTDGRTNSFSSSEKSDVIIMHGGERWCIKG